MLRFLRVRNLAVIREVALELETGLTVFTGETGAGKSILVDALTLLLGARASADLIRTGSAEAAVEGIFRPGRNDRVRLALAEIGVELEEGDLVIGRQLTAAGRGRALVGGALHPVTTLRRLGRDLADIHGQLEHVRLLDPSTHLELLDHHAALGDLRAELAAAFRRLRELDTQLEELGRTTAERARRSDFLGFELREIDDAKLHPGEDVELDREHRLLANRARVLELSEGGFQRLYESKGSVLGVLAEVRRELEELESYVGELGGQAAAVETARVQLEDVALTLRDYARDLPLDARRLDEVESRRASIARLERKYGTGIDAVLAFAERARAELSTLVVSQEAWTALEAERDAAYARFHELATTASRRRQQSARRLEKGVQAELRDLAMEKSRLKVRIAVEPDPESRLRVGGERVRFTSTGFDRVELYVSTNVGEEPRPLARVASGGELSRLLLALRTAAGDHDPDRVAVFHGLESGLDGRVAVFDEVDAGIGGRVAHVLGRKLQALAHGRQVLCITHLPAVAAAASKHFSVRKEELRGRTEVFVEPLDRQGRIGELARMIGGDSVTAAVRRHAEELLDMMASGEPK